jgi:hypothetical protein
MLVRERFGDPIYPFEVSPANFGITAKEVKFKYTGEYWEKFWANQRKKK